MNLISCLFIDKRLEHLIGCSEDERTSNDIHFMHDFRVIILSHRNCNLNKVNCLFVQRRHREPIHVKTTECSVYSLPSSSRACGQSPVNELLILHQVICSHLLLACKMEQIINYHLTGLFKVKWSSFFISLMVPVIVSLFE